jgi:2-haloacid dehalogenase
VAALAQTRWVTFGGYGTLVDWQSGLSSMLGGILRGDVRAFVRAYERHEADVRRERPDAPFRHVLVQALVRAAVAAGWRLSEADGRHAVMAWARLRPFDDVEPMLEALRARGYRLAVLTNADDELFEVTHGTFRAPFDLFLTGERIRAYKPAPWHFRGFARITGVRRENWVHVASRSDQDLVPAEHLGIQRVWLDRDGRGDAAAGAAHVRDTRDVVDAVNDLAVRGLSAGTVTV